MSSSVSPGPVYSHLAADPVLSELVELFVQEMPGRIDTFEALARRRDWSELARGAHQLKGAGGSYGFHDFTCYAARLEAAARDGSPEESILAALRDLLDLCRRVRSGVPEAKG